MRLGGLIRLPGNSRAGLAQLALVCMVVGGLVAYALTGFPVASDYSVLIERGISPDVLHERALAWEAIRGDPSRPIDDIMLEHGYPAADNGGFSPRTPAALLLQLPLLLVPETALMPVVTVWMVISLFGVVLLTQQISGIDWRRTTWGVPFLFVTFPVVTTISYAPFTVLTFVVIPILVAWRFQDRKWAGIVLGVAAAARLWPGLIILGLWLSGRRRASYQAIATFALLNLAGLLLPGVSLLGSLQALWDGGAVWIDHNMNASLALVLLQHGVPAVAAASVAALFGVWLAWRNKPAATPICLIAALLASPLSWPAYGLAALPAVALWWQQHDATVLKMVTSPLLLWFLTPVWVVVPSRWMGHMGFAALVLLLVAVVGTRREPASFLHDAEAPM